MINWFNSVGFVLFSALFGCILGFGLAALMRGIKGESRKQVKGASCGEEVHRQRGEEQNK